MKYLNMNLPLDFLYKNGSIPTERELILYIFNLLSYQTTVFQFIQYDMNNQKSTTIDRFGHTEISNWINSYLGYFICNDDSVCENQSLKTGIYETNNNGLIDCYQLLVSNIESVIPQYQDGYDFCKDGDIEKHISKIKILLETLYK